MTEGEAYLAQAFPLASDVRYGASIKQTLSFLKLLSDRFHEVFYA
ncbi:MAG TPA: hypothetical protein VKX17_01270 [Planctomycetota bacterium]|nr:hypothetical protein [Planctomycetota bacterium]